MNITVLINPRAGGGRPPKLLPLVRRWLPQLSHRFNFEMTTSCEDLVSRAGEAIRRKVDAILALGGDGTLHHIARLAGEDGPAIGVLPGGRGNDFARNHGYPGTLRAICEGFAKPVVKLVDLPTVNGVPFLSIAGTGFDSLVSRLTRDSRCRLGGTTCYIWNLLRALLLFRPVKLRIDIADRRIEGRFMMAAVANAPCYGGGMRLAPEATPDDSLLHVVLIHEMSKWGLLRRFPKVYAGRHVHEKGVEIVKTRMVTLSQGGEETGGVVRGKGREPAGIGELYADGEFVTRLPATLEIGSRRMRVLVPGTGRA